MRMCIVVPIMRGLHESKPFFGALLASVKGPVDLLLIDNAPEPDEGQSVFFGEYIIPFWPGNVYYQPQENNLGVPKSMQFAYELPAIADCGILAFIHNDLYIYDHDWDQMVVTTFEEQKISGMDKIGLAGFFGAERVDRDGTRGFVYSNMLEAEIHGGREAKEIKEILVLDGMSLIASREMLDVKGGVDTNIDIHHFYDLDLSLESIDRGFRNFYLPVAIHHQSGQTACGPAFQEWANKLMGMEKQGEQAIYALNRARFEKKWFDKLPFRVGDSTW